MFEAVQVTGLDLPVYASHRDWMEKEMERLQTWVLSSHSIRYGMEECTRKYSGFHML